MPRIFRLGIDVGGTKLDAQLYEILNGHMDGTPHWRFQQETRYGVEAHVAQVVDAIARAAAAAAEAGGALGRHRYRQPGTFYRWRPHQNRGPVRTWGLRSTSLTA